MQLVRDVLAAQQHARTLCPRYGLQALEQKLLQRRGVLRGVRIALQALAHVRNDLLLAVFAQAQYGAARGQGLGHDALFLARLGLGQGLGQLLPALGLGARSVAGNRGALLLVGFGAHGVRPDLGRAGYGRHKALELALALHFFHVPAS